MNESAAFAVPYATKFPWGRRPAAEEMFTIDPPPALSMWGIARRLSAKAVVTLK